MYSNGTAAHAETETLMPHSAEAERGILGGILIDQDALYDVADFLTADDFYIGRHREIFKALQGLARAGVAIDPVTVNEVLEARGQGDQGYLIQLMVEVPTSINTAHYGRIVRAHSIRRKMTRAASQIATAALDEKSSIDRVVEAAERALFDVTRQAAQKQMETAKDGMSRVFDIVNDRRDRDVQMVGLPTGYIDIDRMLEGLEGGNVYVFAGRPGMGKSLFEASLALHVAKAGKNVARFNLEMPNDQIWQRIISIETGLPLTKVRKGEMTDSEFSRFSEAVGRLSELPMWIDDTPSLTLSQLTAKARRIHAEHGLALVTVDHLGLMSVEKSYGNRAQDVGYNSQGLKRLAKDLDVPVLVLAQLNRSVEQRQDKRPVMSDLRDSGEIEQDADVIMFIYRDEYYNPDTTEAPNVAEVNIAKHRNGPTGEIELFFDSKSPRLVNLMKEQVYL